MSEKDDVLNLYMDAYEKYLAASINSEEAAIVLRERGRVALDAGITVEKLKKARQKVDEHSQRMTDI